jgi:hypothetical protein
MNNTSLTGSTDNKINENPASSTSNIKKSSEKSISISHAKTKDELTSTRLTNDNSNDEKSNSLIQQRSIQATPILLLVAIVSQLLIHRYIFAFSAQVLQRLLNI